MQDAVVETLSVFLVAPGKACGESLAGFYSQLLEPLPLLWQLPIIGLATLLLVVMLLLVFGYEISTPPKRGDERQGRSVPAFRNQIIKPCKILIPKLVLFPEDPSMTALST